VRSVVFKLQAKENHKFTFSPSSASTPLRDRDRLTLFSQTRANQSNSESEQAMRDSQGEEEKDKERSVPQSRPPSVRHCVRLKEQAELANFVGHADENETGDDEVQHLIGGDQHQHAVSVCGQPDVVLRYEELRRRKQGIQFFKK